MTEQQPAAPAPICPEQAARIAEDAVTLYEEHRTDEDTARARALAVGEILEGVAAGWTPQCEVSAVLRRQAADYERVRAERDQLLNVLAAARRRVRGERWLVGTGDELTDTVAAYDRLAERAAGQSEARQ